MASTGVPLNVLLGELDKSFQTMDAFLGKLGSVKEKKKGNGGDELPSLAEEDDKTESGKGAARERMHV